MKINLTEARVQVNKAVVVRSLLSTSSKKFFAFFYHHQIHSVLPARRAYLHIWPKKANEADLSFS